MYTAHIRKRIHIHMQAKVVDRNTRIAFGAKSSRLTVEYKATNQQTNWKKILGEIFIRFSDLTAHWNSNIT